MQGKVVEFVCETSTGAMAADPFKAILQGSGDRLRLGLSREPDQGFREVLGLSIPDVQRHPTSLRVEAELHCSSF